MRIAPARALTCAVAAALACAAAAGPRVGPPVARAATVAAADAAGIADCDDPSHETVLAPAPASRPADFDVARALWLDGARLRWPGVEAGGTFRLYHSATGTLSLTAEGKMRGADEAVDLEPHGTLPAAVEDRFRHAGAGVTLAVPRDRTAGVRRWLAGQLVLAREVDGRVAAATALQPAAALDALYADATLVEDYGAVVAASGTARTTFRLWAPTARRVAVCLYPSDAARASARVELRRDERTGAWSAEFDRDLQGTYYRYVVDVHVRGAGLVRNRVTDPYSLGLGLDSRRSYVARLDSPALQPAGWSTAPRPPPPASTADMSIYELHVRDFSRDDPTVPAPLRGKYLAFTTESAGKRHLRALATAGLTDVHLLPVYDFATVPERGCAEPRIGGGPADETQQAAVAATAATDCYNWGYDPLHFTTPDGSYATDASDAPRRIVEFRAMVQALHRAGLRVGMDVVYNHTYAAGRDPRSVLDRIVPDYYHRLDAAGNVERSTCCANTATEHEMMAKLMIDSAAVWARDYRIDSFRFDLMGHQPRAAMQALQARVDAAAGRRVPLIGEGWNFGEVANGARFVQASQLQLAGTGIATFSDRARDAVRGGGPGDRGTALVARRGFASAFAGSDAAAPRPGDDDLRRANELVRVGLAGTLRDYPVRRPDGSSTPAASIDYAGQPAGYAASPAEVVNYVENHDNHTLFDALALKLPPATSREDRARAQVLALATVALSQGVAYFHAGGELLRSKSLDRNSFDSGDWFNRLDWTGADNGYARGLPPQAENGADWPVLRPRLLDPRIAPTAAEVDWTRRAFLDLLRIRASSTLFRMRTAEDVRRRLAFVDGGHPAVIAARLDGAGYDGAAFREIVYLLNADTAAHEVSAASVQGRPLELHPVHRSKDAADTRAATASYDAGRGSFLVPPLTAVVFVGRAD